MLPVLVTCLDSPKHREWGLDPARIPAPFLAVPAQVGVREALVQGLAAFPGANRVCYAQPEFLFQYFSLDLLYEGGLHRWLAQTPQDPIVFRRIDLPAPADLLCLTAANLAGAKPLGPSTHTGEIELALLRDDPRPKTLVFGDSHVWFLYTATALIGARGVVVEVVQAGGVEQLKVSRHMGPVTMHRLAERGELSADFFRRHGVRPGDRVVAVCGEIDVRNHVGRVAAERGVPVADVIRDLCARFCNALANAVAEFGPLDVVLSCPTPPLDFARLEPSRRVDHWGTLADRIEATHEMRRCLHSESRARGWSTLDLYDAFADAHGALDFERSDQFCHVSHWHHAPAIEALDQVMAIAPVPRNGLRGAQRGGPRTSVWSVEMELLARLSRVAPTAEDALRARTLAAASPDWDRLLRLMAHHGTAPAVDSAISRLDLPAIPPRVRAQIHQERLSHVRDDMARRHAWLELCRAFAERGIRAVTLNGFHVVRSIDGQVGMRPVGDLEFLVARQHVAAAVALLEEMGYHLRPVWAAAIRNVGLEYVLRHHGDIGLASERAIDVALHWETGTQGATLPASAVMRDATMRRADDQDVVVPSAAVASALLVLHGHASSWARLQWLVDVDEATARLSPGEYARVVALLDAVGMRPALGNAWQLIDSLWGPAPGARPAPARGEEPFQPAVVRRCRRVLERVRYDGRVGGWWRPVRRLRDRVGREGSVAAVIAATARPTEFDWSVVSLPGPLRWGYYIVRPIRLLRFRVPHFELFSRWRFDAGAAATPGDRNSQGGAEGASFDEIFTEPVVAQVPATPVIELRATKRKIRVFAGGGAETDWFTQFSRRFCRDFLEPAYDVVYAEPTGRHHALGCPIHTIGARDCTVHAYALVVQSETSGRMRLLTVYDHPDAVFESWNFDPALVDRIYTGQYVHERLAGETNARRRRDGTDIRAAPSDLPWRPWIYRPFQWGLVEEVRGEPAPARTEDLYFRGLYSSSREALSYLAAHAKPDDRLDVRWWRAGEPGVVDPRAYLRELRTHAMALSLPGGGDLCHRDIECFGLGVPVLRPVLAGELAYPLEAGVHYIGVPCERVRPGGADSDRPNDPGQLAHDLMATYRQVRNDRDLLRAVADRAAEYYDRYCAYPASGQVTFDLLDLDSL